MAEQPPFFRGCLGPLLDFVVRKGSKMQGNALLAVLHAPAAPAFHFANLAPLLQVEVFGPAVNDEMRAFRGSFRAFFFENR
jgi:hypothetical protein